MDKTTLIEAWKEEERIAHIQGWDFSHIADRYTEETDLPWDYQAIVQTYLKPEMQLLDIDTGGGEFLLLLHHPFDHTSATEGYPPNVALCQKKLIPLGIDFREGDGRDILPFADQSFDLIINRHGDYLPQDIYRLLKPGGFFITQQVGAQNDRALVELLLGQLALPFPEQYLAKASAKLQAAGLTVIEGQECFQPIRFFDVGALVWFAHIIEWEFPGFSVDRCLDGLLQAQQILEEKGKIEGQIHRYFIVAQKREGTF